jgi:hypothetical protein
MSALIRVACALALMVVALGPLPAASALDHVAPQGFEADGPWTGIASVTDAGRFGCPAPGRAADAGAHSGSGVLASSCPAVTVRFSTPQAYVTLWATTDTGGGVSIAASSDATPVKGTGGPGQWVPLTLPVTKDPTIAQVIVNADNPASRLLIDDLTFSTTAQPDTAITSSGPPAQTNQTTASFDFDSSIGGSTFSCELDGAAAADCTSGKAYTSLADGDHTFTVTATDGPFGHRDATPATHAWHVDTTAPRTRITDGPSGSTTSRTASVSFASADDDARGFECALDRQPFAACASPMTYNDLALGRHTVRVRATDAVGNVEATPATIDWTVDRSASKDASDPQSARLDTKGTPSGASAIEPACSAAANPGEADRDQNGLLDRCQRLPSAKLPITAGVQALARVTDGEVWVKLPGRATAAAAGGNDGWLPLKGASVIPMQSVVDARHGTVELDSAATTGRRAKIQEARFGAGIFQVRQARTAQAKRAARRAAPVELYLQTPAGATNACAGAAQGTVVRTLSAGGAGRYRVWGALSTAHVDGSARWTVSDRCDGTLTTVARGVVTVHDLRHDASAGVRAGRHRLVAGPLFVSLKGGR